MPRFFHRPISSPTSLIKSLGHHHVDAVDPRWINSTCDALQFTPEFESRSVLSWF